MSLRIALITSTFPEFKGCEHGDAAAKLVEILGGLNHEVHVVTSAREEIVNTFPRATIQKVMPSWSFLNFPRLLQALMAIKPDILHINHPTKLASSPTQFLVSMLPEINRSTFKARVVLSLNEYSGSSWFFKKKSQLLIDGSDEILVPTEEDKKALMAKWPRKKENIEVLSLPKDTSGFDEIANQLNRIYSKLVL